MGLRSNVMEEGVIEELRQLSRNFLKIKNSPYRRYFIESVSFKHRLSLLLGQRGVGKTTTLIQFLLEKANNDLFDPTILYVQVDHFLVGGNSLYEIAQEFDAMGGKYLAFDEIHKYPNWSQELKSIYDTFPKLVVVASGSSSLQMYKGSHDLARRAIQYKMVGLSFREFLELTLEMEFSAYKLTEILADHQKIADMIIRSIESKKQKVLPLFKRYMKCGYYPYFFELPNEESYYITLEQNIHATIESDLAAIYPHLSGSSINKLKQLLIFIAKAVPFTPNWNNIKETLEIGDVRTLKTYFKYLEDASLIRSVAKENHMLKHIGSKEKVYLDNPNQMHALSLGEQNTGTERENIFLNFLSINHKVALAPQGDFLVDGKYTFEIGGKKKTFDQLEGVDNGYLACDDMEVGIRKKIPLWLFGFIY